MSTQDACQQCGALLASTTLFCSRCGLIHIPNKLIKTKTTAEFDPGDRDLRPWREPVLLPPKKAPKKSQSMVLEPWRPTMKQSSNRIVRLKGVPMHLQRPDLYQFDAPSTGDSSPSTASYISDNACRYKHKYWQKPGVFLKPRCKRAQSPPATIVTEELEPLIEHATYPLCAYYATWTSFPAIIHVSIYEQCGEVAITGIRITHRWLRIGFIVDDQNDNNDMVVVVDLPDEIAKLLCGAGDEWVNIRNISMEDAYMAEFLQNKYEQLANRLHVSHSQIFDQCNRIYLKEDDDVVAMDKMELSKITHLAAVQQGEDVANVVFTTTAATFNIAIPLGPYYLNNKISCTIECEPTWEPPPESLNTSSVVQQGISPRCTVSGVTLRIYPAYYCDRISPKRLLIGEYVHADDVIQSTRELRRLCRRLASLLRFEYVNYGQIIICVHGVAHGYVTMTPKFNIYQGSVMIQKSWRGRRSRESVMEMRKKRHRQCTVIQRVIRGFLGRRKFQFMLRAMRAREAFDRSSPEINEDVACLIAPTIDEEDADPVLYGSFEHVMHGSHVLVTYEFVEADAGWSLSLHIKENVDELEAKLVVPPAKLLSMLHDYLVQDAKVSDIIANAVVQLEFVKFVLSHIDLFLSRVKSMMLLQLAGKYASNK